MYAPFVEDSDDQLSQLAQLQIFLTLLSSLALRATPPSELVGNMVTVVLFLVPCIGIALETPLLEVVGNALTKGRELAVSSCPGLVSRVRPPTFTQSPNSVRKDAADQELSA